MGLKSMLFGESGDGGKGAALQEAINTLKQAQEDIKKVPLPDVIKAEEYIRSAAAEVPELVGLLKEIGIDSSSFERIEEDPRLRATQMEALEEYKELAEKGFSEEDIARRRQLQREVAAGEQSRQQGILQSMAQRGQLGSGQELAARLASSQASTQRAAEAGDRLAVDQANARRAALAAASQQAGALRGQDYGVQSDLARARDQIAQFNTLNRQQVQAANLQARQALENQRAGQQAQMYANLGNLQQQNFQNQMAKAQGAAGLAGSIAGLQRQNYSAPKKGMLPAIAGIGGMALGGYLSGGDPSITAASGQAGAGLGSAVAGAARADGGVVRKKYNDGGVADLRRMDEKKIQESELIAGLPSDDQLQKRSGMRKERMAMLQAALAGMGSMAAPEQPNLRTRSAGPKDVPVQQPNLPAIPQSAEQITVPGQENLSGMFMADGGVKSAIRKAAERAVEMEDSNPTDESGGEAYADGGAKMAYNDGGEGTIIDSGLDSFAGDMLEDRINDGEMVLNVEQQDRLNDILQDYKRLLQDKRTDTMLDEGEKEVNRSQQDALMEVVRGEIDVEDLPEDKVVADPNSDVAKLMGMLGKR